MLKPSSRYFSHSRTVGLFTFIEPTMKRWSWPSELLTQFSIPLPLTLTSSCLYLPPALLKFFIWLYCPPPTTVLLLTSLSSRREQRFPVWSYHPWASFAGVQALGLQHWGQTPPSPTLQAKPSPTQHVPALLLAAFSLKKTKKLCTKKFSSHWWSAAEYAALSVK